MKLIAIALLINSLAAFAYKPTVESLFRNGSNGEIGSNTAMATFVLKQKIKDSEKEQASSPEALGAESSEADIKVPSIFTYKTLISNEGDTPKLVQVRYLGSIASGAAMNDVRYIPQMTFQGMRLGSEQLEKKFFYSLLSTLVNNRGDLMINFLRDIGVEVQSNMDRVDKEQLYHLGKYVEYLKLDEEARAEQENPLEPSDKDEAEKMAEIFKRPFLTPSPYVKRMKEGQEFFWVVEGEKVYAKFSHDDHKLLEMRVSTESGDISVKCFNYILYGQDIQFPELVLLKDLSGAEYMLNMKKISNFADTSEKFTKRLGNYQEALTKNKENNEASMVPVSQSFAL